MTILAGDAINTRLQSMTPAGSGLQIPPACLLDMQGEPLEYEEGVSLSVRFPVLPRYANPLGHMQGGYIVAALEARLPGADAVLAEHLHWALAEQRSRAAA